MKTLSLWIALACSGLSTFASTKNASHYLAESCSITENPENKSICVGLSTTFRVAATGTALTYKWQVDVGFGFLDLKPSSTFSDVDQPELKVNTVSTMLNGYKFRCLVNGTCGTELSSTEALLTVLTPPSISSNPSSIAVCESSSAAFQVNVSGSNLSFQWQEDRGQGAGFEDLSNSFPYTGANSSTLSISSVASYFNNYKYRCIVSGVCSGPVTSGSATLTVNPLLTITGQPENAYTCSTKPQNERTVTFTVVATGSDLTYQWQVDAGFGFVSPPTTPIHTGINSPTLTVSNIGSAFNGYVYRCIVTSSCGGTQTSESAVLTVNSGSPSQPSDFTESSDQVFAGQNFVTYTVPPVEGAISYDWDYKNSEGGIVPGVTIYGDGTNSVTVDFGASSTSGIMSVCTANGCGLSSARTMNVEVLPGSVLPVKLSSFTATLTATGNAAISWATASESNNDYFTIERSNDGEHFSFLSKAASKSVGSNLYYLLDKNLDSGINYYRLSQTDKDGELTVLGVKAVNVSITPTKATVYPNPLAGNVLKVKLDHQDGMLPVVVSNMNGQQVLNKKLLLKDQQLEVEFSERLAPGLYIINVGGSLLSRTFVAN